MIFAVARGLLGRVWSLLPLWAWALIAAVAYGAWQHHRATAAQAKAAAAAVIAVEQNAARQAEHDAREQENRSAEAIHQVATAYNQKLAQTTAVLAGNRGELDRLRNASASAPGCAGPPAAGASGVDATARFRRVVDECAATVETLAEHLARTRAQVIGLQEVERKRQELAGAKP